MSEEDQKKDVSPELLASLEHAAGKDVVIEYVYANGEGTRTLLEPDTAGSELWQDAAWTNGPPLVRVELRWDPKAAAEQRDALAKARSE